jgi:hypothetical protein
MDPSATAPITVSAAVTHDHEDGEEQGEGLDEDLDAAGEILRERDERKGDPHGYAGACELGAAGERSAP